MFNRLASNAGLLLICASSRSSVVNLGLLLAVEEKLMFRSSVMNDVSKHYFLPENGSTLAALGDAWSCLLLGAVESLRLADPLLLEAVNLLNSSSFCLSVRGYLPL